MTYAFCTEQKKTFLKFVDLSQPMDSDSDAEMYSGDDAEVDMKLQSKLLQFIMLNVIWKL
ncbi:UNVERIFIED_CONTAM: hypothetical protein NCL1_03999 [Trichonephila clavipes]